MSRCPFCGHVMAPSAKKCYHCGYDREKAIKEAEELGLAKTLLYGVIGIALAWVIMKIFLGVNIFSVL